MNINMANKFAIKNIKANTLLNVPFVIANGIMLMLFNITLTLSKNKYVLSRNAAIGDILTYCTIVIGLITFIFALYSGSFLAKKRNKEIALYSVLGMEKRHIRKIINIENNMLFGMIFFIAIIGGYVFGKLAFMFLNWIVRDVSASIIDYSFSQTATLVTLYMIIFILIIYALIFGLKIQLLNPIQLFKMQKSGEGEPKVKIILLILGLLSLGAGYYIALSVSGVIESLFFFFLAVLLVMLGTYLLYGTLSVLILKFQKANKKKYYVDKNFLRISGMLYRIKSNALSLASIAIASTGIIIGISSTAAIYNKTADFSLNGMPRKYSVESNYLENEINDSEIKTLNDIIYGSLSENMQVEDIVYEYTFLATADMQSNRVIPIKRGVKPNAIAVSAINIDAYNKIKGKNIELDDDEILVCMNTNNNFKYDTMIFGDRVFRCKTVENFVPSKISIDTLGVVAKDFDTLDFINKSLLDEQTKHSNIYINAYWNVVSDNDTYYQNLKESAKNYKLRVRSQKEELELAYHLNGGIIFLGIMVSIAFLAGTILIMYYKQINAGYDDREKIQSMKKIGLEDKLIKKTISSQIIWMLFMPLLVATIHSLVASRIVYKCLGLFGVYQYFDYAQMLIYTVLAFCAIYFVIFRITSKSYYKLVR